MTKIQQKQKGLPRVATHKIHDIYGSVDYFNATIYLIARNQYQRQKHNDAWCRTTFENDPRLSRCDWLYARRTGT